MSEQNDQADLAYWANKVASDENIVWTARMNPWKDKIGLAAIVIVFAFVCWLSVKNIFFVSSLKEACSGMTRRTTCEISYFFAWPIFFLSAGFLFYFFGLQLLISRGKIILRYAITDQSVRTSMSGAWNKDTVRPIPPTVPYIRSHSLMFDKRVGLGGLDKSDLLSGIEAVTKLRENAA